MSNNKQSSIEWLAIQLWEEMNMQGDGAVFNKLLEQAKAMHKKEIMDAFGGGCQVESTRLIAYHGIAEQYYNETFNKNEI